MKHQTQSRGTAGDGSHGYTPSGSSGRSKSDQTHPVTPESCCFLLASRSRATEQKSPRQIDHKIMWKLECYDTESSAAFNVCVGEVKAPDAAYFPIKHDSLRHSLYDEITHSASSQIEVLQNNTTGKYYCHSCKLQHCREEHCQI